MGKGMGGRAPRAARHSRVPRQRGEQAAEEEGVGRRGVLGRPEEPAERSPAEQVVRRDEVERGRDADDPRGAAHGGLALHHHADVVQVEDGEGRAREDPDEPVVVRVEALERLVQRREERRQGREAVLEGCAAGGGGVRVRRA